MIMSKSKIMRRMNDALSLLYGYEEHQRMNYELRS